jgi:hypothetical protein
MSAMAAANHFVENQIGRRREDAAGALLCCLTVNPATIFCSLGVG